LTVPKFDVVFFDGKPHEDFDAAFDAVGKKFGAFA
jgi:hypothetical protein